MQPASTTTGAPPRTGRDARGRTRRRAMGARARSRRRFAEIGRSIGDLLDAAPARTVRAAEVLAARLDAVPDDRALAVDAARRQRLDRALERIERVGGPTDRDLECFVVGVSAALAGCHAGLRCNAYADRALPDGSSRAVSRSFDCLALGARSVSAARWSTCSGTGAASPDRTTS